MNTPTPQPDIDGELRKKVLNRLMDNVGHTDEDYETCRSHYSRCSKCGVETYHFKYGGLPNCSHAKKDQLPQSCNCSNGKQAKKDTAYIISLLTSATEKAVRAAILDERREIALDNYHGHTFSDSTDYRGKFAKFIENNERCIAKLQATTPKGVEDA